MKNAYFYITSIGKVLITEDREGITGLMILSKEEDLEQKEQFILNYKIVETEQIKETAKQLMEYLQGTRKVFDIRINPNGTPFQKQVWEALRAIPYGETRSYKEIAREIGNEKASRAVGGANNRNPILCIIPCHRVIGAKGELVGFGAGLDVKEKLLTLEKNNFN